eukprot:4729044-Pleurochrysis_carterae.AAC.11
MPTKLPERFSKSSDCPYRLYLRLTYTTYSYRKSNPPLIGPRGKYPPRPKKLIPPSHSGFSLALVIASQRHPADRLSAIIAEPRKENVLSICF